MTDDAIQELISVFLDARGGYVAGASERELFLLIKDALQAERDRAARIIVAAGLISSYAVARALVEDGHTLISTDTTPRQNDPT